RQRYGTPPDVRHPPRPRSPPRGPAQVLAAESRDQRASEQRRGQLNDLRAALQSVFGHDDFRPYQREIVERVMAGRDVLGVLPTGAGKSLCFQLPALLLPRPTLVISPLIALMKDQLDGLPPEVYPRATLVNSTLEPAEAARRVAAAAEGEYRLVYVAPERLRNRAFLHAIARAGLSRVVVDEAHCVSVW